MMSDRISRDDLVRIYNIEISFFDDLAESGLIKPIIENQISYLMHSDLPEFERFANMHYDLDINIAGLEVIHRLLMQIETIKTTNRSLMEKLNALGRSAAVEDYPL